MPILHTVNPPLNCTFRKKICRDNWKPKRRSTKYREKQKLGERRSISYKQRKIRSSWLKRNNKNKWMIRRSKYLNTTIYSLELK